MPLTDSQKKAQKKYREKNREKYNASQNELYNKLKQNDEWRLKRNIKVKEAMDRYLAKKKNELSVDLTVN
jgi:hypothetical protein